MIFKVDTVLRKRIRLTKGRWNKIITEKHPMMKEHIDNIQETVKKPDLIRKNRWDEKVYLFYRRSAEYYRCGRENGKLNWLYPDKMKNTALAVDEFQNSSQSRDVDPQEVN